jgi:hypothetical protein
MDSGRAKRRRSWIKVALVTIAVPVVMYVALMLAIGLGLSGSY